MFLLLLYKSVSKCFSFEMFQNYVTASVCEWIASLFQTQKKLSCFSFLNRCQNNFKQFFIDLIENCVTAYVCKVTNWTADVKMYTLAGKSSL